MAIQKIPLPVDDFIPQIIQALQSYNAVVVTAAPGAGKTTRIPPGLLPYTKKKIAVLEPRRIAAMAAAYRVAEEENQAIGDRIGYEVRFDKKSSPNTKLVFLTEALLSRKLLRDPQLSEFDIVILDEFHERSLHSDTALALLYELQQLERPDLKIVVMSATLDAQRISTYLNKAPIIEIPGKLFPLHIEYDQKPQSLLWNWDLAKRVAEKIKLATQETKRDVLVFLPGVFEINQMLTALNQEQRFREFLILPLHGRLDLQEQRRALRPHERRKIILSTNVAESSVTIDGLDCVVDTGLERSSVFQMQSGFGKLTTHRISQASAMQRAGRAARQFPGRCYRMWKPLDERSFSPFSAPEIKSADLAETLLFLRYLGVSDFKGFSWFEAPSEASLDFAAAKLQHLQLMDTDGITDLGKRVLQYPTDIRMALLIENFKATGHDALGAWISALLSERVSTRDSGETSQEECDLIPLLKKTHAPFMEQIKKAAIQVSDKASNWRWSDDQEAILKENLARSFADRLGRRRQAESDRGVLANGRGVQLAKTSSVKKSLYFIALEGTDTENSQETLISRASGLSEDFLKSKFADEMQVERSVIWNETKKTFLEKKATTLWGLVIGSETYQPANAEHIEAQLPLILMQNWEWLLDHNENLLEWWQRFTFYQSRVHTNPDTIWTKKNWRTALAAASYGHRSLLSVAESDLVYFFENELNAEVLNDFRQRVPSHLLAAKGRRVKVHYHGEKAPYVEIKLQDAFVWKQTPTVGHEIPLTVVLLAPNMRPTQVTQDLEGFWKGSYAEIRKELKARYPKHDWPETP